MTTFRSFIKDQIRQHGTLTALANGTEMSVSAFSRQVRNENTLGIDSCLRLAQFVGESPSTVLQLAGKADVAALIEQLYGPPRESLSEIDRALIALEPDVKAQLLRLVEQITPKRQRKRG